MASKRKKCGIGKIWDTEMGSCRKMAKKEIEKLIPARKGKDSASSMGPRHSSKRSNPLQNQRYPIMDDAHVDNLISSANRKKKK